MPVNYSGLLKPKNADVWGSFNKCVTANFNATQRGINVAAEGRTAAKFEDYTEDRNAMEAYRADPSAANRQALPLSAQNTLSGMDSDALTRKKIGYEYDQLVKQTDRQTVARRIQGGARLAHGLLTSTKEGQTDRTNGWYNGIDEMFRDRLINESEKAHFREMFPTNMALKQLLSKVTDLDAYQKQLYSKLPDKQANLNEAIRRGYKPGSPQWEALTGGGIDINIPSAEKSYDKGRGADISKAVGVMEEAAASSQHISQKYGQMMELMKHLYTGTGGVTIHQIKKAGSTLFNIPMEGVAEGEAVKKINRALVGDFKRIFNDPRMSDSDRDFYESIPANLSTSAEGIALMERMQRQDSAYRVETIDKWYEMQDASKVKDTPATWRKFMRWRLARNRWGPEMIRDMRAHAKKTSKQRGPGTGLPGGASKYIKKWGLRK